MDEMFIKLMKFIEGIVMLLGNLQLVDKNKVSASATYVISDISI
jgi:hypothetical protein